MIDILMATYNGSNYVKDQIESILNQTYTNWTLYIRDDGSKDSTIGILKDYAKKYQDKIIIIEDEKSGLGAKLNFAELMKYSKNDYCMFSDQDDIWLEDKIELTLNKMRELESKHGKDIPLLVHTDLRVVDGSLNTINNSFWEYQNLNPNLTSLNHLLVQNNITGCTMLMNRKLVNLSKDIPNDCIMHDWWIGLIASGLGYVQPLYKQTILYRQHGKNEVGAHNYHSIQFIQNKIQNIEKIHKSINDAIVQAKSFDYMYKDRLSDKNKSIVKEFSTLKEKSPLSRKLSVINNKFYKSGFVRTTSYILFV